MSHAEWYQPAIRSSQVDRPREWTESWSRQDDSEDEQKCVIIICYFPVNNMYGYTLQRFDNEFLQLDTHQGTEIQKYQDDFRQFPKEENYQINNRKIASQRTKRNSHKIQALFPSELPDNVWLVDSFLNRNSRSASWLLTLSLLAEALKSIASHTNKLLVTESHLLAVYDKENCTYCGLGLASLHKMELVFQSAPSQE